MARKSRGRRKIYKEGWTALKMPKSLRDIIKERALREGIAYYKVVWKAMQFYIEAQKKPTIKNDLPLIDKITWYMTKIAMSAGSLRENPTRLNLETFIKTAKQVRDRMKIKVDHLIRAGQDYFIKQDANTKMELNASVKMVLLELLNKYIEEAKEEPKEVTE